MAAWLISPRHAVSPAQAGLATIPILENLRWGMTVSEVRWMNRWRAGSRTETKAPHHYAMYWLHRYPWRGCIASASLLFGSDDRLAQVWLDSNQASPKSCKVVALAEIEQRYGEGLDQDRLDPHARIADCRPLKPQDRTWPAHMGGVWRCWKRDGTLVRVFDGEPQPLVLSKAGVEEPPFHITPVVLEED